MMPNQRTRTKFPFHYLIAGMGLGALIIVPLIFIGLRQKASSQLVELAASMTHAAPTATARSTPTPRMPPTARRTATKVYDPTLQAAEEDWIYQLEPETAITQLKELLGTIEDRADQARVNELLGDVEFNAGRPQQAAPYYKRSFELDQDIEVLFKLAIAYYAGGDLENALQRFHQIVDWEGEEADVYREDANFFIADLEDVLGTPTPVSTGV